MLIENQPTLEFIALEIDHYLWFYDFPTAGASSFMLLGNSMALSRALK